MADSAILTPGLVTEPRSSPRAFNAIGKGGIVVLTGLNKLDGATSSCPARS